MHSTTRDLLESHKVAEGVSCAVYSTPDLQSITFNRGKDRRFTVADLPRCVSQKREDGSEVRFLLVGPVFFLWSLSRLRKIISRINGGASYDDFEKILRDLDRIMTPFERSGMIDEEAIADFRSHEWLINKEKWRPDASRFKRPPTTFAKLLW